MYKVQPLPLFPHEAQNPPAGAVSKTIPVPWTMLILALGILLAVIGGTWDIAWHMSIGRQTFWAPPHLFIQAESVLVGLACANVIWNATRRAGPDSIGDTVRVLGLRGPAGAFIAAWGSVAMLASAPFDNWWHNAYGLDSKIATPPHVLLALGSLAIKVGAMVWLARMLNRAGTRTNPGLVYLLLAVGGICVAELGVMIIDPTWFSNMHTARCYLAVAIFIPTMMVAAGRGSGRKWGCTIVAAVYSAMFLGSEWLLPLVPAEPKLGPVYHHITHLIPLAFPLLLIVPAFATDLLLDFARRLSSWLRAACVAPLFVLSLVGVQWPFANFLTSPASRNWIFGTGYFSYDDPAGFLYDPYAFNIVEKTTPEFLATLALAIAICILTIRLGLAWGTWMRRVVR